MVTKKRRMSLPNQHTSAHGSVNAACLSLLPSTFSISLFRPAKADFGTPPFEVPRQKHGFYQCIAPCRRRGLNRGRRFTLQRDGSGAGDFVARHGGEDTAVRMLRARTVPPLGAGRLAS